jgi:hypothetical protein
MEEKEYGDFFQKIKDFKQIQNKQKQRGLNDYNILTTVLKPNDEVRVHSRMIGSFLDVNGKHYQDDLFLKEFLNCLNIKDYDTLNSKIHNEYENIDLYLTDGNKHIIIENKIWAQDQKAQIQRYIELIKKENKNLDDADLYVIYLSIDRKQPSRYSLGEYIIEDNYILNQEKEKIAIFKSVHYKNDILNWLNKCQNEVQNITNLNIAIEQYKDVVKIITGKYKPKAKQIYQYILENEGLFKEAQKFYHENENKYNQLSNIEKEAYQAYEKAREEIADEFFLKKLPNYLKDKFPKLNIEVKFNEKDYKYKIVVTNHSKGEIIFGSEGYGTNNDFVIVNGEKLLTKYRYRYSKKSIDDFCYKDSKPAKEYYEKFIKNNLI